MWRLLSDTFAAFWKDECPRLAAALAFYTVFALPALLAFTVMVAAERLPPLMSYALMEMLPNVPVFPLRTVPPVCVKDPTFIDVNWKVPSESV